MDKRAESVQEDNRTAEDNLTLDDLIDSNLFE